MNEERLEKPKNIYIGNIVYKTIQANFPVFEVKNLV